MQAYMEAPEVVEGNALYHLQIQSMNDTHGRWLPVHDTRGGLCLPDTTPDGDDPMFKEYLSKCVTQETVSGRVRAIKAFTGLYDAKATPDAHIIRVLDGDEFQGTPLFSIPKSKSSTKADYGYAFLDLDRLFLASDGGIDGASPNSLASDHLHTYMTIGNHEFDLGITALAAYYEELSTSSLFTKDPISKKTFATKTPKIICTNCDFVKGDCAPIDKYIKASDKLADGTLILGFTPDDLQTLASTTQKCNVKQCPSMAAGLKKEIDAAKRVVVLSHMGVFEDVRCLEQWAQDLGDDFKKIVYWQGSHTHTIPCGANLTKYYKYVNNVPNFLMHDNTGKDPDVLVSCNVSSAGDDTSNNSDYVITRNGAKLFNYPLEISSKNKDYKAILAHTGMFGLLLNQVDITPENVVTTLIHPIDSSYDAASDKLEAEYANWKRPIIDMLKLNSQTLGFATGELSGACPDPTGNNILGCDAGIWFSHVNAEFAINNVLTFDELKAKVPYGTPFGGLYNGGGIRSNIIPKSNPANAVSWLQINTAYPFYNRTIVLKVTGQVLLNNLNYGMWQVGGMQMAGFRLQVKNGFDPKEYKKSVANKTFCPPKVSSEDTMKSYSRNENEIMSLQKDSATFEDLLDRLKKHSSSIGVEGLSEVTTVDPSKFVHSSIGCRGNTSDEPVWEISTMLIQYYQEIVKSGKKGDYYMSSAYESCENWEAIDPKKSYYLTVNDFLAGGGDKYCFDNPIEYYKQLDIDVGMTPMAMGFLSKIDQTMRPLKKSWLINDSGPGPGPSGVSALIGTSLLLLVTFFL